MVKKSSLILAAIFVLFLGSGVGSAQPWNGFSGRGFHRSHAAFVRPHFNQRRDFFRPRFFSRHRGFRVFVRYPYPHHFLRRSYFSPGYAGPYCGGY